MPIVDLDSEDFSSEQQQPSRALPAYGVSYDQPEQPAGQFVDLEWVDFPQEDDGILDAVGRGLRKVGPSWLSAGATMVEAGLRAIEPTAPKSGPTFINRFVGGLADEMGAFAEHQDFIRKQIDAEKPTDLQRKLWGNPDLLLDPRWWAETGIDTAASLVPVVAGYMVGGAGLAGAAGGGMEGGSLYRELLDENVPEETARQASAAYGVVSGVLNAIGAEAMLGKQGVEKLAGKGVFKWLARRAVAGGTEGTSEYLEEPAQAAFAGMAKNKPVKEIVGDVVESLKNIDVIPTSFVMGAATNAIAPETAATTVKTDNATDHDMLGNAEPATGNRSEDAAMARKTRALNIGDALAAEVVNEIPQAALPIGEYQVPFALPAPDAGSLDVSETGEVMNNLPRGNTPIEVPGAMPMQSPNAYDFRGSREDLQAQSSALDLAAHEAATSPLNDKPQPTDGQKEAGNYAKGHINIKGLDISIENPKGSERSGTDPDGNAWSVNMPAHYGYIKGTVGKDKDHLDVYIGEDQDSDRVFIVDQVDPKTGRFDEHKILLGTRNEQEAQATYLLGFSDTSGAERMGAITEMSVGELKAWIKSGNTKKPVAFKVPTAAAGTVPTGRIQDLPTEDTAAAGLSEEVRQTIVEAGQDPAEIQVLSTAEEVSRAVSKYGPPNAVPEGDQQTPEGSVFGNQNAHLYVDDETGKIVAYAPSSLVRQAREAKKESRKTVRGAAGATPDIGTPDKVNTVNLSRAFKTLIDEGKPLDKMRVKQFVAEKMGVKVKDLDEKSGTYQHKAVEEAMEYALVQKAREIATGKGSPEQKLQAIKDLYAQQPNLATRDSMSVKNQQYSTPLPLAYLMQEHTGAAAAGFVYEPTAGNGALVFTADPDAVHVNELDEGHRLTHLKDSGFGQVTSQDALDGPAAPNSQDVVLMNPPFGTAEAVHVDGFKLTKIEHQIAAKGLEAMKDDGKAAFIIGGHNFKDGKMTGTDRLFMNWLYSRYNVTHNIDINGDVYRRQGTSFPIRLVTIEGRKVQPDNNYAPKDQRAYDSAKNFDEVADILKGGPNEFAASPDSSGQRLAGKTEGGRNESAAGGSDADAGRGGVEGNERNPDAGADSDADRPGPGRDGAKGTGAGNRTPVSDEGGPTGRKGPVESDAGFGDVDFDSLFDEIAAEQEKPKSAPTKAEQQARNREELAQKAKATKPKKPKPAPKEHTVNAAEQAKIAMQEGASALQAILENVANPNKLSSGLTFDEKVYEQMRPHLQKMWTASKAAFGETKEAVSDFIRQVLNMVGTAIKPYASKFYDEIKAGTWDKPLRKQQKTAKKPQPKQQEEERKGNDLQAVYKPASKGNSGNNLIPRNMADAVAQVLDRIAEENGGDLDAHVAAKLAYSVDEMYKVLSAEQIDAVALAIHSIDRGEGAIVGDQTGVGKGRVAASIIRYANLQNKIPIFFTEKPKLFSDMHRDLTAIGHEYEPFILHGDAGADVVDANDDVVFKRQGGRNKSSKIYKDVEKNGREYLANNGFSVVFTTYSQVNKPNRQRTILSNLASGSIIILDESHNAAGQSATGEFIRDGLLADAAGVLYSSATYSKRPDTMPVYFRTSLGGSGLSMEDLIRAVEMGGVPLQQIIAKQLAEGGHYIRREQDFSEVESMERKTDHENRQRDYKRADKLTGMLRKVAEFSGALNSAIDWEQVATENGHIAEGQDNINDSISSTDFNSTVHNYVQQMLLALKADAVAAEAVAALEDERKPVIGLMNTMGSFLDDFMAGEGLKIGDPVEFGFNAVLKKALRNTLRYTVENERGQKVRHYMSLEQLAQHAPGLFDLYSDLIDEIEKLDTKNVPASPIDYIIAKVKEAGYSIGEITGRGLVIDYSKKVPTIENRGEESKNRNKAVNGFNRGDLDCLIINRAGSTGLSLHPTKDSGDKRQRHMMIAQADLNIDTVVQMLGRIFRKGQVQKPRYTFLYTSLPSEGRPAIVLEKKLKGMNANTSADSKSAYTSEDVPDMMNKYGDQVTASWLQQNPDVNFMIGDPLNLASDDKTNTDDAFKKVSGRIALLPAAVQEEFYDQVASDYNNLIEYLDSVGQNELVARDMDYKAETRSKQVIHRGENQGNPFSADTYLEKVLVTEPKKPFHRDKVVELVEKELNGRTAEEFVDDLMDDLKERAELYKHDLRTKIDEALAEERPTAALDKKLAEIDPNLRLIQRTLERLKVGSTHDLLLAEEHSTTGVVTSVKVDKGKGNPVALSRIKIGFAVTESMQSFQVPLSQQSIMRSAEHLSDGVIADWDRRTPREIRVTKYLITGNLLTGFQRLKGSPRIINFTRADGTTDQAIAVPKSMEKEIGTTFSEMAVGHEEARKHMLTLPEGRRSLRTINGDVRIVYSEIRGAYRLFVPGSKKAGAKYFLDSKLLKLVDEERGFSDVSGKNKGGKEKAATIFPARLAKAMERLHEMGVRFTIPAEIKETANPQQQAAGTTLYSGIPIDALIKDLAKLTRDAKAAMPKLVEIGAHAIEAGHKTLDAFSAKMKEWLGDLYPKFRGLMIQAWSRAKVKLREERGSFSVRKVSAKEAGPEVNVSGAATPQQQKAMREHAHKTLDWLRKTFSVPGGLGNLPNWQAYLAKRYRVLGTLSQVKDEARRLYDMFSGASKDDSKAIYDFLTTKDADTSAISPGLRARAEEAKQAIVNIGENLVAYGMLDEKTFEANKGAYLPRVYLKHLVGDDLFHALGSGKKLDLGYLKKRKDIPEDVRRLVLGEVKDPAYLVSRAYSIPQRDMALFDWLAEIARHAEWVMPKMLIDWTIEKNPMKRIGKVRYRMNQDGTYDIEETKVRTVEAKHKNIPKADLETFLGDKDLAAYVKAGRGSALQRKVEVNGKLAYRPTPWKRIGRLQYRVNADGSYNFVVKEQVKSEASHKGVAADKLNTVLSQAKTDGVLADEGRIVGGKIVTPFWLKSEAERLRKQIPHMPEEDRDEARVIAEKMDAAANQAMDDAGFTGADSVPKGFKQVPDTAKYGPLRGMIVRKEIHNDLVGSVKISIGEKSPAEKLLGDGTVMSHLNRWWKWAKVAANPPAQVRNFISNMVLLQLSGVSNPLRIVEAIKEVRTNGQCWRIAKRYGVKEATFANTELAEVETELLEALNKENGFGWGTVKVLGAKLVNFTGDAYQLMEAIGKTAKIIDEMKKGATAEAAAMEAHKWLLDYSLVGENVRYLRNAPVGVPFITFQAKILPLLAEVATKKPWRLAPYVALSYGLPMMVASMLDMDDDDLEKIKSALPDWLNKKQHVFILPFKDDRGRWQAIDIGYFFPWTQWTQLGEQVAAGELGDALQTTGMLGGPLPDLIAAIKTNTDPFTGRPIVDPLGTPAEKTAQIFGYIYNMAMPPFLTDRGAAGKLLDAATNEVDRFGQPTATMGQAGLRFAGVNTYAFDPSLTRAQNLKNMAREISDLKFRAKRELSNKNLSAEDRTKIQAQYRERIRRLNRAILEYRAKSDFKKEKP